ncbi:serine/threonine kinase family protein, partial [Plesiocystis pacifica SIR-1]
LLAELEAVPRRRRRRVVVAAGLVAAGALGLALPQLSGPAEATDPCATIEAELDGVWDADARALVSANFERADEGARALDALDRWRDGWIDERRAVCRASGRAEADASLERAKLSCLTRQRQRVDALVDALGGAALDDERSARALDVLRTLPEAEACEDDLGASLMEPPPADQRQRVAQLQVSIDRATDQRRLGDFDAGFELLRSLEPEVEIAGYGPLTAEFMAERAKFERTASSLERGVELLADAIDLAEVHRHEQLAGELWLSLAMLSFNELDDPEAGSRQLRRALVTWQRLSPSDSIRARLEFARGIERESLGGADDLEAARAHLRRAIELVESSEAPSADLPHYRGDLARLHADDPEAQLALLRQAVADGERVWGPTHPRTADFQYQLGNALLLRGENEAARELLDAAVAGWSRAGEGMRERAASEHSLAQLALGEGDLDAAETHARALAQMRAAYLPPDHADHGDAPSMLAIIAGVRGQHELAIDHAREALRHWESKRDASDPEVLYMRTEIANHAHSLGRVDEAVAAYQSILADALPDAGLVLVTAHLGLADLELNRGNVDAAAEQLHAIVALDLPSLEPQTLTFTVLRALVALRQGGDVAASLAAVRAARKDSALSSEQLHAWIDGLTLSDAERDALRGALD